MSQEINLPKQGELIKVVKWTEDHPNTKTLLLKIKKIMLPCILVEYVKVRADEKSYRGRGRLYPKDIQEWELVEKDQFDMLWSLAEDRPSG